MTDTGPATGAAGSARHGKRRRLGGARRWRVSAYPGPRPRVRLKDPEADYRWTTWYPREEETLDSLFADAEAYLDAIEAAVANPTVSAAAHAWLRSVEHTSPSTDTFANRQSLVQVWLDRPVGDANAFGLTLLEQWTATVSRDFLDRVAATGRIGAHRMEDLRTVLAAVRDHAHRQGLLAREVDPLDRVRVPRTGARITGQGGQGGYVDPRVRPTTAAVTCLIRVAERTNAETERSIHPLQLKIGCFLGPRLSEQLGLAVEDIDLRGQTFTIRGAWIDPRGEYAHWRPWTKNRTWRVVGYLGSWQEEIRAAIAAALALPNDVGIDRLADAVGERRADFDPWYDAFVAWHNSPKSTSPPGPLPPRHYLFPDPDTGLPWTQEAFNERFRHLRSATAELAAADPTVAAWPAHIPYRNARHHAATWLHEHVPAAGDADWTVVARLLGHTAETCRTHYVLPAEGAVEAANHELGGM